MKINEHTIKYARFLHLCDAYSSVKWWQFRKRMKAWNKLVTFAKNNQIDI